MLFSDVRGFTAYSERNTPERVIETLNVYLGLQAEIVEQYDGTIDKFVGDEILALFEGEDMELRACRAALDMVAAVRDESGVDDMRVGIGINAGEVVFGSTGSKDRQDYTVIGDTVNLGARLCSAAGADVVVVSTPVRDACGDGMRFGESSALRLKGKAEPVPVFELLGPVER